MLQQRMVTVRRFAAWCGCAASVALLVGCSGSGSYEGPQRAAVTGNVTFDGQPVESGTINLIPAGEGRKVSGLIENGVYKFAEEMGPSLGKHRVEIYWAKPTGKMLTAPGETEPYAETKEVIPAKYNTATTLEFDVVAGENKKDWPLTP